MDEIREQFDALMELYSTLKREVQRRDRHLFERWKAGGFLIDDDIISMYPHLGKVIESLEEDSEDSEDSET